MRIACGIVLLAISIGLFVLHLQSRSIYKSYIDAIDKKQFVIKEFLPCSLFIIERFKYSFKTTYDRKLQLKISEVYGNEYAAFYLRIFHAYKITILITMIISELVILVAGSFSPTFAVYIALTFSVFAALQDLRLNKEIKRRRLEIQLNFADFVNMLALLLNAGLTLSKAWDKIARDSNAKGYFYGEVYKTIAEVHSGRSEADAYSDFAKRLKSPEISRFISTITQSIKRGGNELVISLRLQSSECWEMRKNAVKRLGEEASTKMLIPMMIMFFSIIMIVILPALLSMSGI